MAISTASYIPHHARQVLKFNPQTHETQLIDPDLGDGVHKWECGVLAKNTIIYCAPSDETKIQKINTTNNEVENMNDLDLPESGNGKWSSGALAKDDCIYYLPYEAKRILKLDPYTETISSVGDDFGDGGKFRWILHVKFDRSRGKVNYIYGLNQRNNQFIKFDVSKNETSSIGREITERWGPGKAVARDAMIYCAAANRDVCELNTRNRSHLWIRLTNNPTNERNWGNALMF